ncbi:hypothetical protein [Mesorhizobium sp. M1216]|uniref:hypothetical protein n=1 Tax=Mesorhizobium sp. M1216 TaxID=2957069 RepID=UPI00333D4D4A
MPVADPRGACIRVSDPIQHLFIEKKFVQQGVLLASQDRLFLLLPLVRVAGLERVADPIQHLLIEMEFVQQGAKGFFEDLLADVLAAAFGISTLTAMSLPSAV